MAKLLQVDFEFHGPFGEEMSNTLVDLAQSINQEPGMIWKIWTESEKTNSVSIFLKMKPRRKLISKCMPHAYENGRSRSTRSNLRYQCAVNDD